jgi:hypothetical protein
VQVLRHEICRGALLQPPRAHRAPQGRVGKKKPTQKNPPKNHLKKPTKSGFLGFFVFFQFLIFYENNTNFSL